MKSIGFLFILSLSFLSPPEPVIEWQVDATQDMGLLQQDQPKTIGFVFKNISDEPITIDNVRVACGCTAPEWDLTPVMPNETGTVHIEYDAKKQGYFYKKVRVFFSNQRRAEIIYIEGEVE